MSHISNAYKFPCKVLIYSGLFLEKRDKKQINTPQVPTNEENQSTLDNSPTLETNISTDNSDTKAGLKKSRTSVDIYTKKFHPQTKMKKSVSFSESNQFFAIEEESEGEVDEEPKLDESGLELSTESISERKLELEPVSECKLELESENDSEFELEDPTPKTLKEGILKSSQSFSEIQNDKNKRSLGKMLNIVVAAESEEIKPIKSPNRIEKSHLSFDRALNSLNDGILRQAVQSLDESQSRISRRITIANMHRIKSINLFSRKSNTCTTIDELLKQTKLNEVNRRLEAKENEIREYLSDLYKKAKERKPKLSIKIKQMLKERINKNCVPWANISLNEFRKPGSTYSNCVINLQALCNLTDTFGDFKQNYPTGDKIKSPLENLTLENKGYQVIKEMGSNNNVILRLVKKTHDLFCEDEITFKVQTSFHRDIIYYGYSLLKKIKHPNIANIIDIVSPRELVISVITEFYPLRSLRKFLDSKFWQRILDKSKKDNKFLNYKSKFLNFISIQISMGLEFLHKCLLAHRNLKVRKSVIQFLFLI